MRLIQRAKRQGNVIGDAVLKKLDNGVIPVDEWKPDKTTYVTHVGKTLVIKFNELFKRHSIEKFNHFDVSYKEAYYKQLDVISLYINYFERFYDTDQELLMAYVKLKYMIDAKTVKTFTRESFIKVLHKILLSDSICEKIKKMSTENYRVDLTGSSKGNTKIYAPVLQFNEHHAEILMRLSIAIKFCIPVILHYIHTFHSKEEAKYNLYKYFYPIFINPILIEDVNILGKLHHTILKRVVGHSKPDRTMYGKHEALGSSTETFIEDLFKKNLITDTIFSYRFNGNIISYNSVVLRYQLMFHSKEDLKMEFLLVSEDKEPDGLSGLDKMEMYTTKIDTFQLLFSQVNIQDTISRIKEKMKIDITQEEIDYYIENHDFNVISKELIFYHFAKDFGGFTDLKFIKRVQYIELMIIFKRELELTGNKFLPQLITGNVLGKSSIRIIRNTKFIERIVTSPIYIEICNKKYQAFNNENSKEMNPIITLLSKLINTSWVIVDYDFQDLLGKPLEIDNDVLAHEYLSFVNNI